MRFRRRKESYAEMAWRLIMSDKPKEIKKLEKKLDGTQGEAVDNFIEESCWRDEVPQFTGNKGTPRERLTALRAAYQKQESLRHG